MLKRMTLLAKRSDMETDAFRMHWSSGHAQLALSLPGVCKYTQNRSDEELLRLPRTGAFSADGIVELFFTDAETMKIAQASDTGLRKIPEDELLFLRGWSLSIVDTDGPHDHYGSKVMVPIAFADKSPFAETLNYLCDAAKGSGAEQISVNTVVSSHSRPRLWSEPVAPDVILVCWYPSALEARQAFRSDGVLAKAIASAAQLASAYLMDPLTIM